MLSQVPNIIICGYGLAQGFLVGESLKLLPKAAAPTQPSLERESCTLFVHAVQSFGALIYTGIAFVPIFRSKGMVLQCGVQCRSACNSSFLPFAHSGACMVVSVGQMGSSQRGACTVIGSTSNHPEGSSTSHESGSERGSPPGKTSRKIKQVPLRVRAVRQRPRPYGARSQGCQETCGHTGCRGCMPETGPSGTRQRIAEWLGPSDRALSRHTERKKRAPVADRPAVHGPWTCRGCGGSRTRSS